jgi:hypothetical protein
MSTYRREKLQTGTIQALQTTVLFVNLRQEDHQHILQCPHITSWQLWRDTLITSLSTKCLSLKTDPTICFVIKD